MLLLSSLGILLGYVVGLGWDPQAGDHPRERQSRLDWRSRGWSPEVQGAMLLLRSLGTLLGYMVDLGLVPRGTTPQNASPGWTGVPGGGP
jgi:hypothetical protein